MVSLAGVPCWDHLLNNWVLASAAIVAATAAFCLRPYFFPVARLRTRLFIFAGLVFAAVGLFAWQDAREDLRAEKLDALKRFNAEANQLFEESLHVGHDDYAAYRMRVDGFSAKVEDWVASNVGPRASDIVRRHDPKDANVGLENAADKNQAAAIVDIVQTREKIAALVKAGASDICVKPTTSEHPLPRNLD
jgi:hypothetical protein